MQCDGIYQRKPTTNALGTTPLPTVRNSAMFPPFSSREIWMADLEPITIHAQGGLKIIFELFFDWRARVKKFL